MQCACGCGASSARVPTLDNCTLNESGVAARCLTELVDVHQSFAMAISAPLPSLLPYPTPGRLMPHPLVPRPTLRIARDKFLSRDLAGARGVSVPPNIHVVSADVRAFVKGGADIR